MSFDPPGSTENLDVAALLREVGKNQDEIEKRVSEYAFKQTETDREINGKGELKKQTLRFTKFFRCRIVNPCEKLISENGVPLSPERAAKEDRRVTEEFLKAERTEGEGREEGSAPRAEREKKRRKRELRFRRF